jgi:AcrR family transcriptional regulator
LPKPLLSADAVFDEALRVLAEEGAAGLTVRNLAARLRCSNKTVYQQVGTHDVLVRGVVARAFAQMTQMHSQASMQPNNHTGRAVACTRRQPA